MSDGYEGTLVNKRQRASGHFVIGAHFDGLHQSGCLRCMTANLFFKSSIVCYYATDVLTLGLRRLTV